MKFCYFHRKCLNSVLGKVLAELINKSLKVNKKKNLSKKEKKNSLCFQVDVWTRLSGGIISQKVSETLFALSRPWQQSLQ